MLTGSIKSFLKEYECDTLLFDYVVECKYKLKKNIFIKPMSVETSIKTYDNGEIIKGRYVISLDIDEFKQYETHDQIKIFNIVGFNIQDFKDYFKKNIKLYFGFDNKKGKLYFSDEISLICFEPEKIKLYKLIDNNMIICYDKKNLNDIIAVHIRINDGNNWYSIGKNFVTKYYRPNLVYTNDFLQKLSIEEKTSYKYLRYWYYHHCMCNECFIEQDITKDEKIMDKDNNKININTQIIKIREKFF